MKKFTWIVLFLCGITAASIAQTNSSTATTSQNEEVTVQDNDVLASVGETEVMGNETTVADSKTTVAEKSNLDAKRKKEWKKWSDRTTAGKVLLVVGTTIFVVLCLLFGTVSVG